MEKAIEIKRRAQRCIQNNDLDGALSEYEKLVQSEESDPYNYVLLADLLYKKGDPAEAAERYLSAVESYERASLYKNAIAVCKKMLRLSLSQAKVLKSLANLHALDGFAGESALYYVQYAEQMVRSSLPKEAAEALRAAFDVCQDNIRVLEQLSEAYLLAGDDSKSAAASLEAAGHYRARNQEVDAVRCTERAARLDAHAVASEPVMSVPLHPPTSSGPDAFASSVPAGAIDFEPGVVSMEAQAILSDYLAPEPVDSPSEGRVEGLESGGTTFSAPRAAASPQPEAVAAPEPAAVDDGVDSDSDESAEPVYELTADVAPDLIAEAVAELGSNFDEAGVYEIAEEAEAMVNGGAVEELAEVSPAAPGLAFGSDAHPQRESGSSERNDGIKLEHVESLLAQAQEQFRSGDRELASATLATAAQAYEQLGRHENAATIYRSLGRGAQATPEVMTLWLGNCQTRGDAREAAQVACELGDRALNDGDETVAREWFQQATAFDADNEVAKRRLQRLTESSSAESTGGVAVASATATSVPTEADEPTIPSAPEGGNEMGRVEVAVGRGEAVTFDLGGLLAEFQRGVAAQLSGDAQSHYDLGMTYREMGLIEQAVESFRIAEQDPRLAARALEMTARCFVDQERFAEAVIEFERALVLPDLDPAAAAELRFHMAIAYVSAGELDSAVREFEAVAQVLPGYEDVEARIAALRGATGQA